MSTTGSVTAEGKTKIIRTVDGDPSKAVLQAKDDITAGDGAKHDVIVGKAAIATATTCNVFRLLQACQIKDRFEVAFDGQVDATSFRAPLCTMLPYEVVIRREAHGSYPKRHPHVQKGRVFARLVLEFFLKTANKTWQGHALPKDDPLFVRQDDGALLYRPDMPMPGQEPFLKLQEFPLKDDPETFARMGDMARRAFLILEKAWQLQDRRLVDLKVEFGLDQNHRLLLADVIDNDSWRVLENGEYIDKQVYRDGGDITVVAERYQRVRALTERFELPRQRLILWRGSDKDSIIRFQEEFVPYDGADCSLEVVTCSMHKEPARGYVELVRLINEVPDTVVIAYVGRSNGAGPTLAATTSVPVITVPASWKDFPDDVWSSLRTPSDVPVLTVLEPSNAVLAAVQILAMRNPRLYAILKLRQEPRLTNLSL